MNLGYKLDSSIFQDSAGASTSQGEHATTSEREKPKSKTKIQRFVAWVTKHEMTFDILEALQLAGQLPFFVLFFKICYSLWPRFQYPERIIVPVLSLLASLLYAALALAFYFEFM